MTTDDTFVTALSETLFSSEEGDSSNVVDALYAIARAIDHLTDVYEANL